MKGMIKVLQTGLFSSVQDLGRYGFTRYGVPCCGAMDTYAAKLANLMVNNSEDCALIEVTQLGPVLAFSEPCLIAITGAMLSPRVNDQLVENNRAIKLVAGDVLNFGKRVKGTRAYIAVNGGVQTEQKLNSRSWYKGITIHERFSKGMQLPYTPCDPASVEARAGIRVADYLSDSEIQVYPGPEYDQLNEEEKQHILSGDFSIGRYSNRMGVQIKEKVPNSLPSILTGPVIPGTVQLAPSGQLIILMKDAQTTGGYPRILQLSQNGMNIISQKVMGDSVRFRLELVAGE